MRGFLFAGIIVAISSQLSGTANATIYQLALTSSVYPEIIPIYGNFIAGQDITGTISMTFTGGDLGPESLNGSGSYSIEVDVGQFAYLEACGSNQLDSLCQRFIHQQPILEIGGSVNAKEKDFDIFTRVFEFGMVSPINVYLTIDLPDLHHCRPRTLHMADDADWVRCGRVCGVSAEAEGTGASRRLICNPPIRAAETPPLGVLFAREVPELTHSAGIQLNERI